MHVPTALPFAVGMHASPRSASQAGAVLREPSQGAATAAPAAMQVPVVDVAGASPTHDSPGAHGVVPVKHGSPLPANAAHVPEDALPGVAHVKSRPQSAST